MKSLYKFDISYYSLKVERDIRGERQNLRMINIADFYY
jgi:hypothetical protein